MRISIFLISFLLFIATGHSAFAQVSADVQQSRILILLDRSSSMINKWSGDQTRSQAADKIILQLIDSIYKVNNQVEFSLRVLGHQYVAQDDNCFDTKNEVMFSKDNYTQISLRLASLPALGVTPIAYALKEAAENDLVDEQHNAYSIILITDGGESCGGNICDVVRTLLQRKIYFRPYIVSLVDYAPLKTEYNCLGDYLQVVNDKEIPGAVSKIVDFYRPMLTITKQDYKALADKVKANPPSVLQMHIPAVEVDKEDKPVVQAPPPPAPKPVVQAPPAPKPVVRVPDTITKMQIAAQAPIETEPPAITTFKPYVIKATAPVILIKEDPIVIEMNKHIKPFAVRIKPPVAYPRMQVPPILKPEVIAIAPPAPKPKPKPAPAAKPKPLVAPQPPVARETPMPVTTVNIDAKETMLQVFFTDNKHQVFYHTSPEIILTDAATGKEVKRFFRTVDPAGNPDPIPDIKPGDYNITIVGRNSGNIRGNRAIPVLDKKTNQVTIEVSNGSLRFEYEGAPNRPVDEFSAVVVQRVDAAGKIIKQRCSQELAYDPGNYFLEINTLPATRKNVDVEFGGTSIIYIPIPGYVQFTNANNLGKISLYCPLGDKFVRFYGMSIPGNPVEQRLKLQPGIYQAHFIRNPSAPYASEKIVPFTVKSDAITDVELK